MHRAALVSGLFVLSSLAACREPTQITVDLTTELKCGGSDGVSGTTLSVGALGEALGSATPAMHTVHCDPSARRIGSLVIVPSGAKNGEVAIEVVVGIGKSPEQCILDRFVGGCIVARRALHFVPHASLLLPIVLRAACVDVPCGTTETCVRGQCVPATIGDRCPDDVCDEGALHPKTPPPDAGGDDGRVGGSGSWAAMTPSTSIGFIGRNQHSAVWADKEMLVFGGAGSFGLLADGASYDPKTNAWSSLPAAPLGGRMLHAAVWTGREMIIYGGASPGPGERADGARFDASLRTWRLLPKAPIDGRDSVGAVWATTTKEMLIWGGSVSGTVRADGAAYNPETDTWRTLAPSPLDSRYDFGTVWNGKEMIVFGGASCGGGPCADAAAYNPKTDSWRPLPGVPVSTGRMHPAAVAVGDGSSAAFFAGGQPALGVLQGDGVLYDGALDRWTDIPTPPPAILPEPARTELLGWWGFGRLYVWGGQPVTKTRPVTGAGYDPVTRTWTAMASGAPNGRTGATVVWTGTEAIVYGGTDDKDDFADGARFRP